MEHQESNVAFFAPVARMKCWRLTFLQTIRSRLCMSRLIYRGVEGMDNFQPFIATKTWYLQQGVRSYAAALVATKPGDLPRSRDTSADFVTTKLDILDSKLGHLQLSLWGEKMGVFATSTVVFVETKPDILNPILVLSCLQDAHSIVNQCKVAT